jgi:hypothetical protein
MTSVFHVIVSTRIGLVFLTATLLAASAGIILILRTADKNTRVLGRRMIWINGFLYAAIYVEWAQRMDEISATLVAVLLVIWALHYWCIPILILLARDGRHNWHVWAAWLCITAHFLWEIFIQRGEYDFLVSFGFVWIPPTAAVVGMVVAELLFRTRIAMIESCAVGVIEQLGCDQDQIGLRVAEGFFIG